LISLNKAVFLTQGNPITLGSLLSSFAPDSSRFVAAMEPVEGKSLFFSQISHQAGGRSAHFHSSPRMKPAVMNPLPP